MARWAKKRDLNHTEVVQALRAAGYQVTDYASLGHVLDLVVRHPADNFRAWVEVKQTGEKMTPFEIAFCRTAPGLKVVAYGGQDAVDKLVQLRRLGNFQWAHDVIGETR